MVSSIYIHIPFCLKKCDYCDFLSFVSTEEDREKYVNTVIKEIKLYPNMEFETVYFGGGTPSILTPEQIQKIILVLNIKDGAEITLEVNPKTVDIEKLKNLKKVGINRLSIGVQSFNDLMLKNLGRLHSREDAINCYNTARTIGFDNISLDLMFSLPNQSKENLLEDLKELFKLKPEHFSIYSLIWEENTIFFEKLKKGLYRETDNDIEAEMFELIIDEAKKNKYEHYEISNFSLKGKIAIHNSNYWKNKEYLGVGLGASGYFNNIRYKNDFDFLKYYDKIVDGKKPILEKEYINEEEKLVYEYILGLRLISDGIIPKNKYIDICEKLYEQGFLIKNDNIYKLSKKGIFMANDVFDKFL